MINEKFILVGIAIQLFGDGTYAWHTLKGKTKPNRVTWFLWAVAPLIAFSAQLSQGIIWQALIAFASGFGPLTIFLASFVNRKAYWKITRLDIICGVISVLALMLWLITGQSTVAIVFSILADFIAGIPTIVKSYQHPKTEHPTVFRNGAISATITLLTIQHWNFASYGFALYILCLCLVLYTLIRFKIGDQVRGMQHKTA